MKKLLTLLLLASVAASTLFARDWKVDSLLRSGFETTVINQGKDYSGNVISTVIRKQTEKPSVNGILYVHGFNDYFFQKEMADTFVNRNYSFYAVDLRKYGRSHLKNQKLFQVRNMREYFPDIDSAIRVMQEDGIVNIILMGHSTGGLTTSLYMAEKHPAAVRALILNSPFLDWNLSPFIENIAVPVISAIGKYHPEMRIPQGGGDSYGRSLLKGYDGEWEYDTELKLPKSPDVDAGWIRAIDSAQNDLRSMCYPIKIPVLLMYSSKSVSEGNDGDAVLDVKDIRKYGIQLGCDVTPVVVRNGLHDLVLSRPSIRQPLYRCIFKWLSDEKLPGESY